MKLIKHAKQANTMNALPPRPAALIVMIASAVLLSGCGGTTTPAPAGNATPNPQVAAPSPTVGEQIAALVNGERIPLATLEIAVQRQLAGIRAVGDALPADPNAFRLTVLDTLIEQKLIEQQAATLNIAVTANDVETEIQENVNLAGGRDKWLAQLQADSKTEADARVEIRDMLIGLRVRDQVTKTACAAVEQIHVRHILLETEAQALEIKAKLDAGEDFAKLAGEFSRDNGTRETGGDLGWFSRGTLTQPTVEDAAFAMQINAISAPVKSDLGYHVIQLLERASDRPIDQEMCFRLSKSAFEKWLAEVVAKAKIERYPNGK